VAIAKRSNSIRQFGRRSVLNDSSTNHTFSFRTSLHHNKQFFTSNRDRIATMTTDRICDLSPSSSMEIAFSHRSSLHHNGEVLDLHPQSTGSLAVTRNTSLLAVFWNSTFQPVCRDELRQLHDEEGLASGPTAADILGEALTLTDVMSRRTIKIGKGAQSSTSCLSKQ
jgi:hypothetical protein